MDDTQSAQVGQQPIGQGLGNYGDGWACLRVQSGHIIPMQALWSLFSRGQLRISTAQHTLGRCFVTLAPQWTSDRRISPIEMQTASRVLCGDPLKVIASDLSISISTACNYWRSALSSLCEVSAFAKAGAFLVKCAYSQRSALVKPALAHGVNDAGDMVLSAALWDGRLEDAGLSPSEREIAEAIALGKAAAEISRERNTSPRTVANQLNAIYRKCGVSGRRALAVAALVQPSAAA